jgi:hypothetical protein
MLDRDEGAPVANLKDDWQPPPAALPEVRQYRKQLVQHITALPAFGVASASQVPSSHRALLQQLVQRAYVHNNRNNPITKKKRPTQVLCFFS